MEFPPGTRVVLIKDPDGLDVASVSSIKPGTRGTVIEWLQGGLLVIGWDGPRPGYEKGWPAKKGFRAVHDLLSLGPQILKLSVLDQIVDEIDAAD